MRRPIWRCWRTGRSTTIADADTLRRLQTRPRAHACCRSEIGGDIADVDPRRPVPQAFLRLKIERGLYREKPTA